MIEAKPTKNLLRKFLFDLRIEDKKELREANYKNVLDEFYHIYFDKKHKTYFLLTDKFEPLAIGGAYVVENKVAKVWLLVTNKIKKYKVTVFKYIKLKLDEFKKEFDVLYNFIFESNFASLEWLKNFGFKYVDLETAKYKLFYYIKGDKCFDIRYFAC